jgi:hypothetical protein
MDNQLGYYQINLFAGKRRTKGASTCKLTHSIGLRPNFGAKRGHWTQLAALGYATVSFWRIRLTTTVYRRVRRGDNKEHGTENPDIYGQQLLTFLK